MQHALTAARTATRRQPLVSFTSGIVWLTADEVSGGDLVRLNERLGNALAELATDDEPSIEDLRRGLVMYLAEHGDTVEDLVDYWGEHEKGWR